MKLGWRCVESDNLGPAANSGAIGPLIPVGNGPGFRWDLVQSSGGKWSSFFEVTGMVDHLPEWWTTWTGTVDQITGIGQLKESWRR
jgi:hypothetical protein